MTDYERGRRDERARILAIVKEARPAITGDAFASGQGAAVARIRLAIEASAAGEPAEPTRISNECSDWNCGAQATKTLGGFRVCYEHSRGFTLPDGALVDGAGFVHEGRKVPAEPPGVGTCETCSGTGWTYIKSAGAMGDVPIRCPDCAGVQSIREEEVARPAAALAEQAAEPIHYPVPAPPPPSVTCQTCGGPGLVRRHGKDMPYERCPTCKGTGKPPAKGAL